MARLVLHIGAHKTATTYLQMRFARNRKRLLRHGVLYPECGGNVHHACLAGPWIRTRLPETHFGGETRDAHFARLVAEYARHPGTVLLSAEAFSRRLPDPVDTRDLAARLSGFEDVRIVLSLREQAGFLSSVWMQRARNADCAADRGAFVARVIDTGMAHGLEADFTPLYRRYAEAFGAGAVHVLDYADFPEAPDGPFGEFLRLLGVAAPARRFADVSEAQANRSPPPLAFELARRVTAPHPPTPARVDAARTALRARGIDRTSLLTRDEAARLASAFGPRNRALVAAVRAGGQPEFTFAMPDPPGDIAYLDDLTPEDVAAVEDAARDADAPGRRAPSAGAAILTGASGGIGAALAPLLAARHRPILLCGRDRARLETVARAVGRAGGRAEILAADLRDPGFAAGLAAFAEAHPVALLVVGAGVTAGHRDGVEPPGQAARVVGVTLAGAIATVEAVLPGMIARGQGRIALISSIAALSPTPHLLSYSAAKAGLSGYAAALERAVAGRGVAVSLVLPGFVATPMTARHGGPTPFVITPDDAARRIARGLARGRRRIVFPRRLALAARALEALPWPLRRRLPAGRAVRIAPDADERAGTRPARDA